MRTRRRTAVALLTAALLALSGCGDWSDQDQFEDRLEAIDAVYQQGKDTRKLFGERGIEVSETHCSDAFVSTGATRERDMIGRNDDAAFQGLRRQAFINGCMDRPNDVTGVISGTPTPSTAAPSPSS